MRCSFKFQANETTTIWNDWVRSLYTYDWILHVCRWTVCQLDVSVCGCGSKWKTDVGPQMWKSSLVLTIHNFGVPNFDPSPCFSNISQSEGQEKRTPRQGRSLNTSSLGCGGLLLRKRGGCSVDACSATFYKFYSNIISWRISFLKDSESLFSRLIHLAAYPVSHWMCILQLCDSHARTSCIKQLFCNVCLMQEPMLVLV